MAETRRRSSRLAAAENKSPAKAHEPENSSDEDTSSSDDNSDDEEFDAPAESPKRARDGSAKSPQQQKQPSPAQRGGKPRAPAAARKKRKVTADGANGDGEAAEEDGDAAAAPDAAAGPGPSSVAAAAGPGPAGTVPAKPKPAAKRGKAAPLASLHNLTLWDIITKHPTSVERAAKEWVDRYCQDKLEATSELMSTIVQAGGCDSGVSVEDVESGDMDDVVKRLVDTIVRDGGTEPFRDKKLRNLRASYESFWDAVVSELHAAGRLLDDHVCDRLNNLLIGLSVTKVRGYRHAGTLTAGLLVTGWVRAQQQLADAISTARHQEEAAQKQKKAGADKKRLIESLQRQAEAAQRQVRQLKSLLESTFTAVFAVRFRDVGPEIRAVVIDLVGRWIGLLPATFMVDHYLKYVAWALSDRDAGVRATAVSRLLELFGGSPTAPPPAVPGAPRIEPPAHLPLLHDFVARFTGRFKELPYDVDEEVAVLGVRLLTRLVAVGALTDAQLPASDCYRLLIDNPPAIRRAASELAGQLLREDAAKLEARYAQIAKEAAEAAPAAAAAAAADKATGGGRRGGRSKAAAGTGQPATASGGGGGGGDGHPAVVSLLSDQEQRKRATMLGALLEMMSLLRTGKPATAPAAADVTAAPLEPGLVEELVDALYERLPVLRSWRLVVDCLSDELLAKVWGPMGLAHLAQLLAAALRRARLGAPPAEKGGGAHLRRQNGPRSKAHAPDGEALTEASQVLIAALPRLLRRHQTDESVVAALVSLIRDLKLELFSLRGDEAGWRALLGLVGEQLATRGAAPELLAECAETLTFAASSGPPALQPSAGVVLREACDQLAASLAAAATAVRRMEDLDLVDAVSELAAGDRGQDTEELLALRVALLRTHAVLVSGGTTLAADPRVYDAVDELLAGCGSGRLLGPELTGLLAETQLIVLLNSVHQINAHPSAAAAPAAAGGPGPSGSAVQVPVQRLQQARDALVSHLVSMHAAAASAQADALLEPEDGGGGGGEGQARSDAAIIGSVAVIQDVAFRVLSDVALVFGSKAWKGTQMEPACLLTLSSQMAGLMWRHCAEVLRSEDTREDEQDEEDQAAEPDLDEELGDDLAAGPRDSAASRRARRLAAVAKKMAVVGCLGRLLAHDVCGDAHRTIATNLTAEFCSHGPEVADLIRDVCREMAASRPHGEMPQIYTGAMRQCWASVTVAGELGEEEEHEALQRFAELAKHIASMYAGHGTSRSELLHILRDLTAEALVDAPTNLAILAWGAASFVPKLAPADAATLVSEMEGRLSGAAAAVGSAASGAADLAHERDDPDWAPMYHYLGLLKDKASKGRVAPRVLKGASATTPKAARKRKITFAPSPHDGEEGEEAAAEEEEEEAAAEPAKPQPKAPKVAARAAAAAAPPPEEEGAWLQKAVRAVRKPAEPVYEDEEEVEEEVEEEATRTPPKQQRKAGPQPAKAGEEQAAKKPPPPQQQQPQQRGAPKAAAAGRKQQGALAADLHAEEGRAPGAAGRAANGAAAAGVAARLRAVDVDAGPLNSQALSQSPSQSRGPSAGPSRGHPAEGGGAPSDLRAITQSRGRTVSGAGEEEEWEEEPEEERQESAGAPSDLRAITQSRGRTVSGAGEEEEWEEEPEEERQESAGAPSDLRAITQSRGRTVSGAGEEEEWEEEPEEERQESAGAPSDLRAITQSRGRTASGQTGSVRQDEDEDQAREGGQDEDDAEREEDEDEADAEPEEGGAEGYGTPVVLPTEEELPPPARRTPGKRGPRKATPTLEAAAAAPAAGRRAVRMPTPAAIAQAPVPAAGKSGARMATPAMAPVTTPAGRRAGGRFATAAAAPVPSVSRAGAASASLDARSVDMGSLAASEGPGEEEDWRDGEQADARSGGAVRREADDDEEGEDEMEEEQEEERGAQASGHVSQGTSGDAGRDVSTGADLQASEDEEEGDGEEEEEEDATAAAADIGGDGDEEPEEQEEDEDEVAAAQRMPLSGRKRRLNAADSEDLDAGEGADGDAADGDEGSDQQQQPQQQEQQPSGSDGVPQASLRANSVADTQATTDQAEPPTRRRVKRRRR
ncbi:hypothetical protein PLESTF_000479800 [Pleodorina starrii]|nr:hypothetical protein PLESTF_000479800 [Pleodorina starrii]